MSNGTEEKNSRLGDHYLAQRDLAFEVSITANATPADKEHGILDLSGVALLRTEGKTAEADAVEDLSGDFTTAVDNSTGDSQFGILLKGSELEEVAKVLEVEVKEQTALATSIAATPAASAYLTAGGNIAIDVAGTGLNLASESPKLLVKVKYLKKL